MCPVRLITGNESNTQKIKFRKVDFALGGTAVVNFSILPLIYARSKEVAFTYYLFIFVLRYTAEV